MTANKKSAAEATLLIKNIFLDYALTSAGYRC